MAQQERRKTAESRAGRGEGPQRDRTLPSIRHNICTLLHPMSLHSIISLSFAVSLPPPLPTVCQIALATDTTGHTSHRSLSLSLCVIARWDLESLGASDDAFGFDFRFLISLLVVPSPNELSNCLSLSRSLSLFLTLFLTLLRCGFWPGLVRPLSASIH